MLENKFIPARLFTNMNVHIQIILFNGVRSVLRDAGCGSRSDPLGYGCTSRSGWAERGAGRDGVRCGCAENSSISF